MSTDLEVGPSADLASLTLDELGQTVSREHAEVERHVRAALPHAIRAGEALLAARERIEWGEWTEWLDDHVSVARGSAYTYMRLATHRDRLPDQDISITGAVRSLRGLPAPEHWPERVPQDVRAEAQDLRNRGMTYAEIGDLFGVSANSVRYWIDADYARRAKVDKRKRRQRAREAREALKRQERDRAVKRHGGSPSHAYADLRKSAAHLQRAIDEAEDREAEARLRAAYDLLTKAEDEIAKALKVT